MNTVGLRELRQNASEILREVEAGQVTTVTVSGRPVAEIVPIRGERWVRWDRVRDIFATPTDPTWDSERRAFGDLALDDPWER